MKYYVYLLKGYNNYFNRIIKGYATIAEYLTAVGAGNFYLYSKEVNYNPADNVSTELIMNDCPFEADYLIYVDDSSNIVSRWFVMETVKTRNGQYKYSLRRDLIYDYHEDLLNSHVYIQKAYLPDNDPFILNYEGMSFNEIKTEETLLKDKSLCSWIVLYLAKNATPTSTTVQLPAQNIKYVSLSTVASSANMTEAQLANILNFDSHNVPSFFTSQLELRYGYFDTSGDSMFLYDKYRLFFTGSMNHIRTSYESVLSWNKPLFWDSEYRGSLIASELVSEIENHKSTILSNLSSITNRTYLTSEQLEKLQAYNGKIVLYNGAYYIFNVEIGAVQDDPKVGPDAYMNFNGFSDAINDVSVVSPRNDGEISIWTKSTKAFINMVFATASTQTPAATLNIPSTRNTIQNQAFDIIAINNGNLRYSSSVGLVGIDAIKMAMAIAKDLDANVYDVQLLPYCPVPEIFNENGILDLTDFSESIDYDYIKSEGAVRNYKKIEDNEWTITGTEPSITAQFSYTFGIALSSVVQADYIVYNKPDNVVITKNLVGRTLTITVNAETAQQVYDLQLEIYGDWEITGVSVPSNLVIYPKSASFSTLLNYNLLLKNSVKVESQCNKYRLVSPNYQGSFEFNVAKNGGTVPYFLAECTYKPYTPYIKVAPAFSWLYGANYGDNRGLICGGDFSIPRLNSAWEAYELNNKNYQNIFNREIQSLDLEQSINMRNQLVSATVGTLGGGVAGAAGGAMASGSWVGAVVGGAVGTIGGTLGAVIDTDTLARQQRDQRSLAIDKYNYQLGNIKALPYTLTKVGAFDINSKIWPFLEYYTCTDEEKEALENKINFESMTVMRIGLFGTYYRAFEVPRYFKGELIRNTELAEDNHIFEAIYSELLKGVYM